MQFGTLTIDTTNWDELRWNLWDWTLCCLSRHNIQRWLAGRLLPANISAAALEELFRQQCPGKYAQRHHFLEIKQI